MKVPIKVKVMICVLPFILLIAGCSKSTPSVSDEEVNGLK